MALTPVGSDVRRAGRRGLPGVPRATPAAPDLGARRVAVATATGLRLRAASTIVTRTFGPLPVTLGSDGGAECGGLPARLIDPVTEPGEGAAGDITERRGKHGASRRRLANG